MDEDLLVGFNIAVLAYADDLSSLDLRQPIAGEVGFSTTPKALFPRTTYVTGDRVDLAKGGFPERGVLNMGAFAGGELITTLDAHLYNPTKLHRRYLKPARGRTLVLLTQRSMNDMCAYARWEDGELARSISVNPVGGVWEDIGTPEVFEAPFWRGDHPSDAGYPLPFHPLDLSAAALRAVLGLQPEGNHDPALTAPEDVRLQSWQPQRD